MSADHRPGSGEQRDGVDLTNLDQPLGPAAGATKRDLVDYLDAVAEKILPGLAGRPLTVLRALRGRAPFMQKNVPKYIEYHPTLGLASNIYRPTHLVLDLDPAGDDDFAAVVAVAYLVRRALADSGLSGAVKTSGAKGVHVFVDSTRAGGATVAAAYSPRLRAGTTVSFPVSWSDLDRITPADFTVHTAVDVLAGRDPWADSMPAPQRLPDDLIEHGRTIPVARVAAMHEGKRRASALRDEPNKD